MALTIPHNSQEGIAVASGGRAANYVGASTFRTPGQSAMPEALERLVGGMNKLGGALHEIGIDRQRMQNATDLLADKIDYENSLREFDSNYRQTKQGTDARTAAEDYDAFHKERLDILHKKWGGKSRANSPPWTLKRFARCLRSSLETRRMMKKPSWAS